MLCQCCILHTVYLSNKNWNSGLFLGINSLLGTHDPQHLWGSLNQRSAWLCGWYYYGLKMYDWEGWRYTKFIFPVCEFSYWNMYRLFPEKVSIWAVDHAVWIAMLSESNTMYLVWIQYPEYVCMNRVSHKLKVKNLQEHEILNRRNYFLGQEVVEDEERQTILNRWESNVKILKQIAWKRPKMKKLNGSEIRIWPKMFTR